MLTNNRYAREKSENKDSLNFFLRYIFSKYPVYSKFCSWVEPPLEGKNRRGKVHQCPTWFPNVPLPDMYTVLGVSTPLNGVCLCTC